MNRNESERIEKTTEIDVSSANLTDEFYPMIQLCRHI